MEPGQVINKSTGKILGEAFLVGFASTCGMFAVVAILQNRKRISDYTKRVARFAIQEAR